jgi:hypothetical protein
MRTIQEGPVGLPATGDSHDCLWKLASEIGERESVRFAVTGSAAASAIEGLPGRVREAITTDGRSEVERVLGWSEPPRCIEAGTAWITLHHGDGTFLRVW